MDYLRCLEFFSGIGGMHFALKVSGIAGQIVNCFDVNIVANTVYKHNFNIDPIKTSIDVLKPQDIDKHKADCWFLSPPCQPYTRGGKLLDDRDNRAKPLLHLIEILPQLRHPPKFIFVENVLNFEKSKCREKLVRQLCHLEYSITECLLSPLQFGIPNHRLRYYLAAQRSHAARVQSAEEYLTTASIHTTWPLFPAGESATTSTASNTSEPSVDQTFKVSTLDYFLQSPQSNLKDFLVPHEYLTKILHGFKLDIVHPHDKRSATFTKAYGSHHIYSSGSLTRTDPKQVEYNFSNPVSLLNLGIRFFTPLEIARLHAFPVEWGWGFWKDNNYDHYSDDDGQCNLNDKQHNNSKLPRTFHPNLLGSDKFTFPENITNIQKYRLLGNSLNVWVVAELFRCVLFTEEQN
ncbi:905_t:CDS:2 [Paraglomus occultum]|uniref:tRNA (cytosine(38)-C(5))-methyltransferase n=1 Tax=Paraglomus occultum TaxID=144539 RepID=A0A9N8Z7F8_9GLOM|nr:905_t:CDS:2 [Paraglomus occultum]